jgi:hypothetical protein
MHKTWNLCCRRAIKSLLPQALRSIRVEKVNSRRELRGGCSGTRQHRSCFCAGSRHLPELHGTTAVRIEVNAITIWRLSGLFFFLLAGAQITQTWPSTKTTKIAECPLGRASKAINFPPGTTGASHRCGPEVRQLASLSSIRVRKPEFPFPTSIGYESDPRTIWRKLRAVTSSRR